MNITERVEHFLNEKMEEKKAKEMAITDHGLPETAKVYKFYSDDGYWVIVLKFKNKFYGLDSSKEVWEEDNHKSIIKKVKDSSGVDL